MRLDESSRRRPGWDGRHAVWIDLADGSRWALPKPWMMHGRGAVDVPLLCGPELDQRIDAVASCRDNGDFLVVAASLGAFLIQHHYDLSDGDLNRLFAVRAGDPSSWDWTRTVLDVATGNGGDRSFGRWQRLTLLAQSPPDPILLEDAVDLCDFLEATGRTIPRSKWAVESIAAVQRAGLEALF